MPRIPDQLAAHLNEAYAPTSSAVKLVTHTDDLELGIDCAIPCALILNELIANAFIHAFAGGASGTIRATLQKLGDGRVRLAVADDGSGFPPGWSAATTPTFGMRIVVTLARQLGGELVCSNDAGTTCEVVFRPESA